MKKMTYDEVTKKDQELIKAAADVMSNAYAPYSKFCVGAAVRSLNGKIYRGANMENASYGLTVCAEVAALSSANSDGQLQVEAIAVVGGKWSAEGKVTESGIITPCGRCRQLIAEAAHIVRQDVQVFSATSDLSQILVCTIDELLPFSFGADSLR